MEIIRNFKQLEEILRKRNKSKRLKKIVAEIIEGVKKKKDLALIEYTKKFDRVKLTIKDLRVSETEISAAFHELNGEIISALKVAIENVSKFYKTSLPKNYRVKENNKYLITRYLPFERVGIYIPAGSAPLVSTVYMAAIPAIIAGVKEIVLVSPPQENGKINPFILAVASLLKIKEIYRIGGAQAIAALALGTPTIKKVDKIIGPGNEFVTEAKRQLFGEVDIDMLAGPSEVLIIASSEANLDYIVSDIEAQTEHRGGIGIVITNSLDIFNSLAKTNLKGFLLKVKNLKEAIEIANKIAPEHLEILTRKPERLLKFIFHAGAIFLGENTPVAIGDYLAGPSHILPTQGTARFFSALSLRDFLREQHIINYTKKALEEEAYFLEKIAYIEGMTKHIHSVKIRVKP